MRGGRRATCVGLIATLAACASAPSAHAQPVRRLTGLDLPFQDTERRPDPLPTMSPVPPRSAYQPPGDPGDPRDPPGGGAPVAVPPGAIIPTPRSKVRNVTYGSRYGTPYNQDVATLPDGTKRVLFTGGVLVSVESADGREATEFAADDVVIWYKSATGTDRANGFTTTGDGSTKAEVYLAGNVVVRSRHGGPRPTNQTLRAKEVYYDAEENRAVAVKAELEMALTGFRDPLRLEGDEVRRLDLENWEVLRGSVNASKLPSDPGLRLDASRFTLNERRVTRRNLFGAVVRDLRTGEPVEYTQQLVTGENVVTRLGGVPVFYLPKLRANANDPLGPLEGFSFTQNRVFGSQFYTSWDVYELLALRPPPGDKWRLDLDYLSDRGPAVGTDYTYRVPGATDRDPARGQGLVKLYGLYDRATADILGGYRGAEPQFPDFRGRALWRHQQEVGDEFYYQGQLAYLSDKNFLEQYYKNEFDTGPNQETFAYLSWARRNLGASALVEYRLDRAWVSETNWLPRGDAHLLGQTFLDDLFVYSARASAGYAQARPTEIAPFAVLPTDRRTETGRFNLWQELSAPFALGPVKLDPYAQLALTEYTNDLTGNEIGRAAGGGGVRASLPFSRLYGDVSSELLNLRGLYHKVVVGGNYRYTRSNEPYTRFPLLDRLNDDTIDQTYRNITPYQPLITPGGRGFELMNSPVFNPQLYAIRRLVENRVDTVGEVNVLQMDVRQRFQTKRGYPGMEHTVDFLTLDVSASYFPDANRDNFGHPFSFLEYSTTWNVGDRTALVSNGWFEPYQGGSRYWTAGVFLNRTDRTSIYLGYRQTDPLNSKAVNLSANYQLSSRYYVSTGLNYDFGLSQALTNSFTLSRTGTDLTVTVGFTYNAFVNNFGFTFLVVPNLLSGGRFAATPIGGLGRR